MMRRHVLQKTLETNVEPSCPDDDCGALSFLRKIVHELADLLPHFKACIVRFRRIAHRRERLTRIRRTFVIKGELSPINRLATSIPSIRSVCCPVRPPRIRIAPRPCSAGTIVGAWFENKWHRDKSRSRLSSSCRHHGQVAIFPSLVIITPCPSP